MKALEFSNILLNLIDLLASYKEADITVNGREIKDIVIHMIEERPRIDIVSENPVPLGPLPRHPREIGPEKPDKVTPEWTALTSIGQSAGRNWPGHDLADDESDI